MQVIAGNTSKAAEWWAGRTSYGVSREACEDGAHDLAQPTMPCPICLFSSNAAVARGAEVKSGLHCKPLPRTQPFSDTVLHRVSTLQCDAGVSRGAARQALGVPVNLGPPYLD